VPVTVDLSEDDDVDGVRLTRDGILLIEGMPLLLFSFFVKFVFPFLFSSISKSFEEDDD
jgi:hypothetical protein